MKRRFVALAAVVGGMLASPALSSTPVNSKGAAMPASKSCKNDALHRSRCMIELILDDLETTLGPVSGGGISQIKAASSTSYTVSLPREKRVSLITYEFDIQEGTVTLKGKTAATKSY